MTFNLLPWRENLQRKKLRMLLMQIFGVLLPILLVSAFVQCKNQSTIRQQKQLISHLNAQKPKTKEASGIETKVLDEISAHTRFIKFLTVFNTVLPNTVYLIKVEKIDRSLQLFGHAPSHAEILALLDQFNKKFPNEKLLLSETNHSNKNNEEVEFTLTYHIK